ncbi:MAG TPA: type II secretion system protein [Tepidisphaeraceae bacterium]|jgi:prepilin-type N-terminal cleavage/methylation domain-containing protein|nr:type II secretion system protein [Tepidisphaeraceae bacterium]
MNLSPIPTARPTGRGFSLVELLVVIGIIGVLIAILVPTVSRVRASANAANSQQVLSTLASAIERYHADFRAYPGVFSNDTIADRGAKFLIPPATLPLGPAALQDGNITQSENLVLSLVGGLQYIRTAPVRFEYDAAYLGRGTPSLGAREKLFPAYIEASAERLSVGELAGPIGIGNTTDPVDSAIPEFLDGFGGDPLPVIYIRARAGAQGVVDPTGTLQYDIREFGYYGIDIVGFEADFPEDPDHTPPWWAAGVEAYFINPKLTTGPALTVATLNQHVAVQKDTYVLISAGKDRKYGTKDDICNFSPVK